MRKVTARSPSRTGRSPPSSSPARTRRPATPGRPGSSARSGKGPADLSSRAVSGILILTAVELEARTLARHLELPALASAAGPVYGRDAVRITPVGLGAHLLDQRATPLRQRLERPLVVSAGACAGLDPMLRCGDVVVPGFVLGPAGELQNVTPDPHRAVRDRADSTGPLVTV